MLKIEMIELDELLKNQYNWKILFMIFGWTFVLAVTIIFILLLPPQLVSCVQTTCKYFAYIWKIKIERAFEYIEIHTFIVI